MLKPDIVTMDIEMPVMGGLEAIEKIMAQHPVPILVITAQAGVRTAFDAISKGALDVIEKPDITDEKRLNLVNKIRRLYRVDLSRHLAAKGRRSGHPAGSVGGKSPHTTTGRIVVIAASTGGPHAIHSILSRLPGTFPVPIVITQHIAEGFTRGMADWLDSGTSLTVSVACNDDRLVAGRVYINPAEHSMTITGQGTIALGNRDPRQIYNPSCNTLLSSVATTYREHGIGLILTGMGNDGVIGIQAMKQAGGVTLAQDEKSSVVFGMNQCAIELGCIDKVLALNEIPAELLLLAGGSQ
jgi:two-component system chemotaxis response regulator CheB